MLPSDLKRYVSSFALFTSDEALILLGIALALGLFIDFLQRVVG